MLIDDDPDELDLMETIIKRIDKSILCIKFLCPVEALRIVCKQMQFVPNYIFIDINMPRLTGDQLLSEMRNNPELKSAVITMLSSSMTNTLSLSLQTSGADFAFEKPKHSLTYRRMLEMVLY